jgi:hypothetical protein
LTDYFFLLVKTYSQLISCTASRHKTTIKISSRSPIDDVCRPHVFMALAFKVDCSHRPSKIDTVEQRSVDPVSTGENVLHSGVEFRYHVDELTGF